MPTRPFQQIINYLYHQQNNWVTSIRCITNTSRTTVAVARIENSNNEYPIHQRQQIQQNMISQLNSDWQNKGEQQQ